MSVGGCGVLVNPPPLGVEPLAPGIQSVRSINWEIMTKGRLMGMNMQKNVRDEGGEEVKRGEGGK